MNILNNDIIEYSNGDQMSERIIKVDDVDKVVVLRKEFYLNDKIFVTVEIMPFPNTHYSGQGEIYMNKF